jgi:hypothetical protein
MDGIGGWNVLAESTGTAFSGNDANSCAAIQCGIRLKKLMQTGKIRDYKGKYGQNHLQKN